MSSYEEENWSVCDWPNPLRNIWHITAFKCIICVECVSDAASWWYIAGIYVKDVMSTNWELYDLALYLEFRSSPVWLKQEVQLKMQPFPLTLLPPPFQKKEKIWLKNKCN